MAFSKESKISFFFQTKVSLRDRTSLKKFVGLIFRKEKKSLNSLNYIFCTDQQLLQINRQYLKHDYYTDIITFDLALEEEPTEGEIYISVDRVRENAKSLGEPFYRELHRVIFHGALHLTGYNDSNAVQKSEMRAREDYYLSLYFK